MKAIFTQIIFMKLLCKTLLIRHELHVLISSTEQTLTKVYLSHNIKLHTSHLPFIGEHLLALILLNSPLFDHCYLSWTWALLFIMNLAEFIHHEPVHSYLSWALLQSLKHVVLKNLSTVIHHEHMIIHNTVDTSCYEFE